MTSKPEPVDLEAVAARKPAQWIRFLGDKQNGTAERGILLTAAELAAYERIRQERNALIFAVGLKHLGETRYETALRYIREAETSRDGQGRSAAPPAGGKE